MITLNEIKIEVKLTEEDVYLFQKNFLYQKFPRAFLVIFMVVFAIYAIASLISSIISGGYDFVFGFVPFLLILIIFIFILPFSLKKGARNFFKQTNFCRRPRRLN